MTSGKKTNILECFTASYDDLLRYVARRLGGRVDADDVMQDAFFRVRKVSISPETRIDNPQSYLFRLTDNLALDHLRGEAARARRVVSAEAEDAADEGGSPEHIVDCRQRLAVLHRAIQDLPPRQKQVFLMHKYDGLSHAEIARDLGITRSAVEKLIMKALAHCRARLGDLMDWT